MSVGDNFFSPAGVTIAVGGTVTWTWVGSNMHSATGSWDSGIKTSGTFSHSFPTAGTFSYLCVVHGAGMSGTVTVVAP